MNKEFRFRSDPFAYDKEYSGVKNNTVRVIDLSDKRFTQLIAWMELGFSIGDIQIEIVNSFNEEKSFVRNIQDICIWNDLMIITWKD